MGKNWFKDFFRSRCKNVNLASNAAKIDILFYTCQGEYMPMAGNLSHNKMITSACSNVFWQLITTTRSNQQLTLVHADTRLSLLFRNLTGAGCIIKQLQIN